MSKFLLKELRKQKGWTQEKLSKKLGVARSTIAMYESGSSEPDFQTLNNLAEILNVSLNDLFYDANRQAYKRIPVLGKIPAGIPLEMIEDIIDFEELNPNMFSNNKEYFALKIQGNSMFPKYLDNDVIIVLKQNDCESGQDCVVAINGNDATFKKVIKKPNSIVIQPINLNDYNSVEYTEKQIIELPVRILGVAVEIRRTI